MKAMKKALAIVLIGLMVFGLVACNHTETDPTPSKTEPVQKETTPVESEKEPGGEDSPDKYPYVIMDQAGREISIDKQYTRVAMTSVRPVPAAYLAATGSINELIGINPSSMVAAENSMLAILAPGILDLETGYVEGNDTNIEELLKLKPDVAFCLNSNTDEIQALEAVGIRAVGMETNGTDAIELFSEWAKLIGDVMGKENQAGAIIERSRGVASQVKGIAATIPEEDKKSVLFLYANDGVTIKVAGSNLYSEYWCDSIGAINAAADVSNVAEVNMEQIYAWNPDYIIITNFTETQADDLYKNTYPGQDWSSIKAIQNGNVYKTPLGIYRWFTPTSDGALMLQWIAQTVYPDYFDYFVIEEEILEHYSTFYHYDLSDEELDLIMNPSSDAGSYKPKAN